MTENEKKLLDIVDMHTAGEPVRIIDARHLDLGGGDLLTRRARFEETYDHIRRAAMMEPRGHADMYGVVLITPSKEHSDVGAIFIHHSGYSSMCGHATIALGRFLAERGAPKDGRRFQLECPCGEVSVERLDPARSTRWAFDNVAGRVELGDLVVSLPGSGNVHFDVAYGGAFYAILSAGDLGISFGQLPREDLRRLLTDFMAHARDQVEHRLSGRSELARLYGAILTEDGPLKRDGVNHHLCWFAEGQLDRSPTGSGVTARLALAAKRQEADIGQSYAFAGASGLAFRGIITAVAGDEVKTAVSGEAYYTAAQKLILEEDDPIAGGLDIYP